MEDWLAGRFQEVLAEGRRATVLQGQLAVIFAKIGASEAALQAAMETGGQALRAELADLAQLEAQFHAVGAALAVMDLIRIRCSSSLARRAWRCALNSTGEHGRHRVWARPP
jgi:hypothetical protein